MPPGLQLAQAVHAAFQISEKLPETIGHWFHSSNFLVIVAVPDEAALIDLAGRAGVGGVSMSIVREPDLEDTITAVALPPGDVARRLCSQFPLALKETSHA